MDSDAIRMYDRVMTTRPTRKPRPYGECYTKSMRVRFPPEVDSALRRVRRLFKISMSEIVRAGTMQALVSKVPEAVRIIDNPKTSTFKRLKMIEFLK